MGLSCSIASLAAWIRTCAEGVGAGGCELVARFAEEGADMVNSVVIWESTIGNIPQRFVPWHTNRLKRFVPWHTNLCALAYKSTGPIAAAPLKLHHDAFVKYYS
jgi:hypothetical protein